jgi:hypothetical protein
VLLEFRAMNGEFSNDRLIAVLSLQLKLLRPVFFFRILFAREMFINFRTL